MSGQVLKQRDEIKTEYKWKLEDLFASDEAWERAYREVKEKIEKIPEFQGKLGESADTLYAYLQMMDDVNLQVERIYVYAGQKSHEDMTLTKYQEMADSANVLSVLLRSRSAFDVPELLAIPAETMEKFMEEKKDLELYRVYLEELERQKPHYRREEVEEVLALAAQTAEGPSSIFTMFNNADMRFGNIVDEKGEEVELTHGNFIYYLKSQDRRLRRDAFQTLYHAYGKWENTLAAVYLSNLKQADFMARARRYDGALERSLDNNNIPVEVYYNLIDTVEKHLPAMHRYVALRKKALGVEKLHMYDLYVPMVSDVKMEIPYEKAKEIVKKGLQPMGEEYLSVLEEGFHSGWIDVYENRGKKSGAYSWGAYGTHPYVLLNHQDDLNSVFTLAHEMGHAIHTYYSAKTQPYVYAGYRIFVAEVASTCNENLLMDYMLSRAKDEREEKYFLNHYLEEFRTTLFRQTMFAEFEMITHEMVSQGQPLSAENLKRIYHGLNVKYFGNDMEIDEEIDMEWARIPHFYTPFYVYQYATGYSAAIAISRKIRKGEKEITQKYKEFLSGGSSRPPIELLKICGVDMASPEPVEAALTAFEEYLSRMEALF